MYYGPSIFQYSTIIGTYILICTNIDVYQLEQRDILLLTITRDYFMRYVLTTDVIVVNKCRYLECM